MAEGQIILLTIDSVVTKIITGRDDDGNEKKTAKMTVTDVSGKKYSYFVDEADGSWGQGLSDGNRVYVYTWDKESTFRGKKVTYHNISKPHDDMPPPPPVDSKGIPVPIPLPDKADAIPEPPAGFFENIPDGGNGDKHVPYTSDKDTKIRWMNAMNNAVQIVAALDCKKLGEPQIKNYIIDYANFFNSLEAGMTMDTLTISKAQVIKLHEIMIAWGLGKQEYHLVLEKIIEKQVTKTTDLSYQEAKQCIELFDATLKSMNVETLDNQTDSERAAAKEEQYDDSLPF